ncbi:hypothetical protein HPB48_018728 [Haemaphysalis longicornis]|uniref:Suppressor of white apricot N-terminal domain-containing protein n=1 Tax=Haemaphysalis longicornis TaxID=44386 RepID=A0A9J6GIP6_HAELO|nr:hypothetical protein HPB48_018728 [Haemaphysalis longicornis]
MFFSQTRSSRDNMWHEARKQERKIRGMLVDLKERAERRKEFYERIKQDPAQFLQLHGRRCKIHIDLAIAQAADSPVTMGNRDIMIDRFDVRAHLDMIPEYKPAAEPPPMTDEQKEEERQTNYERYRTLVQNDFLGVTEDKFLHQIYLEERYGPIGKPVGTTEDEKKKLAEKKAAISYVYEDSTPAPSTSSNQNEEQQEEEEDKEDLSDIDLDVTVDVNELTIEQSKEMNDYSHAYGMESTDFISYLHLDKEEQERLKQARELEEEKAMYSLCSQGQPNVQGIQVGHSQLSFCGGWAYTVWSLMCCSLYYQVPNKSSSRSRSRSPQNAGEITFITSFGDDASDDEDHASKKALFEGNTVDVWPRIWWGVVVGGQGVVLSNEQWPTRRKLEAKVAGPLKAEAVVSCVDGPPLHVPGHRRQVGVAAAAVVVAAAETGRRTELSAVPGGGLGHCDCARRVTEEADAVLRGVAQGRTSLWVNQVPPPKSGPAGAAGGVLSVREKLKRKMQAALNKQYKADKRAEREKQDKLNQERWDRAEELRGMALRLRQREREKRHKERDEYGYDPDESRDGHDGYSSRSGSRSRSRSRSPEPRPPGESPYSGPPPDYPRNSSYSSRRRPAREEVCWCCFFVCVCARVVAVEVLHNVVTAIVEDHGQLYVVTSPWTKL